MVEVVVATKKMTMMDLERRYFGGLRKMKFEYLGLVFGYLLVVGLWDYLYLGFGFGYLVVLDVAGPWVAAHFQLEQWAQRREKQKKRLRLEAIPEIVSATRSETTSMRRMSGEDLSWGVQEARRRLLSVLKHEAAMVATLVLLRQRF